MEYDDYIGCACVGNFMDIGFVLVKKSVIIIASYIYELAREAGFHSLFILCSFFVPGAVCQTDEFHSDPCEIFDFIFFSYRGNYISSQ